jgi:hypothetical protein
MSEVPDIRVPKDDIKEYAPQVFENVKTGYYTAVFKGDAEVVEGDDWKALVLPFTGFANDESEDKFIHRTLNARYNFEFAAAKILRAAKAFGLTVEEGGEEALITRDSDELVDGFNAYAGKVFKVFVKTGPRRRPNEEGKWRVVYREGTDEPWIDSKIDDVEAT